MDKKYYLAINVSLLVMIGITFYFQVKSFNQPGAMQWIPLIVLGAVALTSFILQKKMKLESWYLEQIKIQQPEKTKAGAP